MSERELHVPRLGRVVAARGFRLVAAMNPFDAVGTARISSAVYDRVCRLSVDYQSAAEEADIVARAVGEVDEEWVRRVVELVRRTRTHPDLRVGSSVRGALDATAVVASLSSLRGRPAASPDVGLDAVLVALSGRVRLRDGCARTAEEIITELWFEVFGSPDGDDNGAPAGKASAPTGASPS
jgi:MoxR-like ATPase